MSNNTFKKIALYTLGTFSGIAVSLSMQSFAETRSQQPLPVDSLRTMAEVYSQVKANYYQDKTDDEILEGALKGMVSNLDRLAPCAAFSGSPSSSPLSVRSPALPCPWRWTFPCLRAQPSS